MTATRRLVFGTLSGLAAVSCGARAVLAGDSGVVVSRAAGPIAAAAEHFTGSAEVSASFRAPEPARASGAVVAFSAGARTGWHSHPLGQTLIVLSGTGLVQRWGDRAKRIGPGDTVWIPPGLKHWHGAGPDGPMTHVAISEVDGGRTVDWLEKVSADQYTAAASRL